MIALSEFSPYVLPYADRCPEFVIQDAILATVQDFYRKTREKEVELPAINVVANQGVYTLTTADAHIFEVRSALHARHGLKPGDPVKFAEEVGADWRQRTGTPGYFDMPGLDQVRLVVAPAESLAGGLLVVGYSYPSRTATTFDDILIEEHRDLIVNGALGRLLTQQDQHWTNLQQGVARTLLYEDMVKVHLGRVARGRVHSRKRVKPHWF